MSSTTLEKPNRRWFATLGAMLFLAFIFFNVELAIHAVPPRTIVVIDMP
jgi:hypothetical protein